MNGLINKLKEYQTMPIEIEKELLSKIRSIDKKKGDFLYKENQFPNSVYLLTKGCLKTFYKKKGKQKNTMFVFENLIFGSTSSIFLNLPARDNAQFLEDSTVEFIYHPDLISLHMKYPKMETYRRKIAEEYCILLEEKSRLTENTATEKYRIIIEQYPKILQRVSLQDIANLLNISQETLSRIRSSIRF